MSSITNEIKNKNGNKSKLLFTDTDSLMHEIKTEDVYEDFSNDKEMFDFSNYSTDWKYINDSNKLTVVNERWNRWCRYYKICVIEVKDAFILGRW